MKRRIISVLVLASLLQAYSCKDTSENKVLTKEITFKKEGELTLKKAENDSVLATLEIEISELDKIRTIHLSKRSPKIFLYEKYGVSIGYHLCKFRFESGEHSKKHQTF